MSAPAVSTGSAPGAPPSTGRLLRYTGWNLFGLCAPMIVAFLALPPLRARLGADAYGAFMFVLTVVNYLTILDLGLGRATTRFMAMRLGQGRPEELPGIFWTAIGMMTAFGVAGMAVFMPLIGPIVTRWSHIPPALQPDACNTLLAAAFSTPFLVVTASVVGVLEAHQKFRRISLIRVPMQVYTFLGPLAVALVTRSLLAPVVALLAGKIVECGIYFSACLAVAPSLKQGPAFRGALVRDLFRFGGWMSVSSIAMLVLAQSNSALMFCLLPVAAVGVYGTVAEVVIRLLVFPRAWVSVLFPSFSAQHAVDGNGVTALYAKGIKGLLLGAFPVMFALFAFSGEALAVWQDEAFAAQGAAVMRWLVAGLFVYSLSYVPFSLLQAVGHPGRGALLQVLEIPLYLALAWWLMGRCGVVGAGMAWFVRCVVESVAMYGLAHRFARPAASLVLRTGLMLGLALAIFSVTALLPNLGMRMAVCALGIVAFLFAGWGVMLSAEERQAAAAWLLQVAERRHGR